MLQDDQQEPRVLRLWLWQIKEPFLFAVSMQRESQLSPVSDIFNQKRNAQLPPKQAREPELARGVAELLSRSRKFFRMRMSSGYAAAKGAYVSASHLGGADADAYLGRAGRSHLVLVHAYYLHLSTAFGRAALSKDLTARNGLGIEMPRKRT